MRWFMVISGLLLQPAAVFFYVLAVRCARNLNETGMDSPPERPLKRTPFLYLAVSCICLGTGTVLVSIFALLDSDPVLLFSQMLMTAAAFILLLRFKTF